MKSFIMYSFYLTRTFTSDCSVSLGEKTLRRGQKDKNIRQKREGFKIIEKRVSELLNKKD